MRKKKRYFSRATCFVLCAVFALLFALSLYATGGNLSLAVLFLLLCMPRGGCA